MKSGGSSKVEKKKFLQSILLIKFQMQLMKLNLKMES